MEHAASPGVVEGAVGFLQSIADFVESLGEFGSWQKAPAGLRRGLCGLTSSISFRRPLPGLAARSKGVESF